MIKKEPAYKTTPKGEQYLRYLTSEDIQTRLQSPATRQAALAETAEWIKDTCLYFGASPVTAYKVAAAFIEGLAKDLA